MTLDRLLGALPEQHDLAALRQALLRASVADATLAWSRSSAYATADKRVVSAGALVRAVADAAKAAHERVDALYAAVGEVLTHAAAGDERAAGLRLISIGESEEARDQASAAVAYYEVAVRFSETQADRAVRVLGLRRLGRAHLAMGEAETALAYYRASAEQAVAAGDLAAQIIALTGAGNVLAFQGRWAAALEQYQAALRLCADEHARLRGQLFMNIANTLREQGLLEESGARLIDASALWTELEPQDQSVWYNNRGLLALAAGEIDAAEAIFRQALETAPNDFDRAMVLDNLAELFIRQDNLADAEGHARSAEELALRAGSPRALAEIYTRLGKIFRLRADLNGVTFFEKALELCRGRSYPLTEANAYLEYGLFRRTLGDNDEARSYIERARQLYVEIGAVELERSAAEQLA